MNSKIYTLFIMCLSVFICGLIIAAEPPNPASPKSTPQERIIFVSNRDNGYENIYSMNIDGTDVKRISKRSGDKTSFFLSRDGKNIAYINYGNKQCKLIIMDISGENRRTLEFVWGNRLPSFSWAPDGKWIAVAVNAAYDESKNGLYIVNIKHMKIEKIMDDSDCYQPRFSPDGKKVAFESARSGCYQIYILELATSKVTQLTSMENEEGEEVGAFGPAWSPDGKMITFYSSNDLYLINTDGSNLKNLTNNNSGIGCRRWAPDGGKIIFEAYNDIYVINTDGTNLMNLTNNTANDISPAWSSDSKKIVFLSNRDGKPSNPDEGEGFLKRYNVHNDSVSESDYEIYIMDANGTNVKRLTNDKADDESPLWVTTK